MLLLLSSVWCCWWLWSLLKLSSSVIDDMNIEPPSCTNISAISVFFCQRKTGRNFFLCSSSFVVVVFWPCFWIAFFSFVNFFRFRFSLPRRWRGPVFISHQQCVNAASSSDPNSPTVYAESLSLKQNGAFDCLLRDVKHSHMYIQIHIHIYLYVKHKAPVNTYTCNHIVVICTFCPVLSSILCSDCAPSTFGRFLPSFRPTTKVNNKSQKQSILKNGHSVICVYSKPLLRLCVS